ncbi:hypothetical protein AB8O55_23280 [Saccharopolyspora cebuensis]|uniref:MinD-like ATPase involved in chromosome partitioning or flagellar assembly n=1 Tax=Saccharopolyspora cebuensis TaxID=418759 RepID=A0ABV4CQB8_9PSEU
MSDPEHTCVPNDPTDAAQPPPSPSPEPERSATTTNPWSSASPEPSSEPSDLSGLEQQDRALARAAAQTWADLPAADMIAAAEAGRLAASTLPEAEDAGVRISAATGEAAAAVQRQGLPPASEALADWSGYGTVIPVLAASPGAGASVVVAAIADELQAHDGRVLLVDTADPARSGLAESAHSDGPALDGPHPSVRVRFSWRDRALVARAVTELPVLTPGMVPPPRFFKPAAHAVQATVVDLGHDTWRVAAHPLAGAGAWLRRGTPPPRPILVCRATRPSLLHAEQVLARLEAWGDAGFVTPPAQLVVVGAKRWAAGVPGAAGRRTGALLDDAVFLPHDPTVATTGITADTTPARLRAALTPLLRRWDLVPPLPRMFTKGPNR